MYRYAVGTLELQKTLPQPLQSMQGVLFFDYGTDMVGAFQVMRHYGDVVVEVCNLQIT